MLKMVYPTGLHLQIDPKGHNEYLRGRGSEILCLCVSTCPIVGSEGMLSQENLDPEIAFSGIL